MKKSTKLGIGQKKIVPTRIKVVGAVALGLTLLTYAPLTARFQNHAVKTTAVEVVLGAENVG